MSALDSTLILLLRRERSDRERKPEEMVRGGHGDWGTVLRIKGGSESARIWKFNYNCALAVIPLV